MNIEEIKKKVDEAVPSLENTEELRYLLSIIEQYQSVVEVSRNKAQILASYCAHAIDSGRTVHGEYAFDKSQELFELLRDTLQVIRGGE